MSSLVSEIVQHINNNEYLAYEHKLYVKHYNKPVDFPINEEFLLYYICNYYNKNDIAKLIKKLKDYTSIKYRNNHTPLMFINTYCNNNARITLNKMLKHTAHEQETYLGDTALILACFNSRKINKTLLKIVNILIDSAFIQNHYGKTALMTLVSRYCDGDDHEVFIQIVKALIHTSHIQDERGLTALMMAYIAIPKWVRFAYRFDKLDDIKIKTNKALISVTELLAHTAHLKDNENKTALDYACQWISDTDTLNEVKRICSNCL